MCLVHLTKKISVPEVGTVTFLFFTVKMISSISKDLLFNQKKNDEKKSRLYRIVWKQSTKGHQVQLGFKDIKFSDFKIIVMEQF